ncbi:ABC transporter permease [Latilactobacillus sakei]|uniref:ABC transporter permease n=1 Tax=Latilactobacillus sakei TaxID=1599 RepID=UPI00033865D7|nr:ABC transporter permease [Latilactobacillus sakei]EOR84388.1 ABC transporter permease/transmembrane protein [Latilactobacillus sakei subsp. sakei LS25]PKX63712.1 ABC transporter permease [Latilactobacillus sakei]PKX67651.1 ABC transporter permease [Latilactobacillus sakei]
MLLRLLVRSTINRARDYAAYLMACIMAIVVYFCFTAIKTDPVLSKLKSAGERLIFGGTIQIASIIIILFAAFFLAYANLFFMKKRRQEIGMLSVIGVTRLQISVVFFAESLVIGTIALLIGLFFGIFLSKLFGMLLLRMMGISVAIPFLISWGAIKQTTITFGLLFLLTGLLNSSLIFRYQLVDLLHPTEFSRKIRRPNWLTTIWGIIGIVLIISGYYLAERILVLMPELERRYGYGIDAGYLGAILWFEVIGTLAFFQAYTQIWLRIERHWKRLYYRGTHLLSVTNLSYRFKKNAKTLWMITILSAVTITALGSAAMIYTFSQKTLRENIPADIIYSKYQKKGVEQILRAHQVTPKKITETTYKIVDAQFELATPLLSDSMTLAGATGVLPLSRYNALMARQFKLPATPLRPNEAIAMIDLPLTMIKMPHHKRLAHANQQGIPLQIKQPELPQLRIIHLRRLFPNGVSVNFYGSLNMVAVPDQYYDQIKPATIDHVYALDLTPKQRCDKKLMKSFFKLSQDTKKRSYLTAVRNENGFKRYRVTTKEERSGFVRADLLLRKPNQDRANANFGFYMYIALFIALTFMLATGSIIMLKQLSEAQEEILQYKTLKRIGMTYSEIKRTIYFQILIIFLLPIILGTLHAIFAIRLLSLFLDNPGLQLVYIVCGIFIMIYFVFYLVTAEIYNRIVNIPLNDDVLY